MGNILYAVAAFLIIVWALGLIEYNAGPITHILLLTAIIAIIAKVTEVKKNRKIKTS